MDLCWLLGVILLLLGTPLTQAEPLFGTWTIEASYPSAAKQRFKATFNVKEYVLPSFDVQLIPNKTFFYLKDEALGIDIQAWWKLRSLSSQRSSLQPG
ncbi:complement C3-like isoform X2 [Nycticebus coucang]|uniref:complement C3-like isoform X2 n=1 Tax=Nycticebus coucang TaxID=9470 RepID=UPI00234DB064|nr:complement C3-like isoform X2 [Nycticebus coucang]